MLITVCIKLHLRQAASSAARCMIPLPRIFGILRAMSFLNTIYVLRPFIPCHTFLQSLQRLLETEKKMHNLPLGRWI